MTPLLRCHLERAALHSLVRLATSLRCLPTRHPRWKDPTYKARLVNAIIQREAELARAEVMAIIRAQELAVLARSKTFAVTDDALDAPDGAEVDGYRRVGSTWFQMNDTGGILNSAEQAAQSVPKQRSTTQEVAQKHGPTTWASDPRSNADQD